MKSYLSLVRTILSEGVRKENRTGIDTLSCFGLNFRHDLANGFPLLTTKKMDGKPWKSLRAELLWFISGEPHIRNLQQFSHIWDSWADADGSLETAYGFFWRNFPHTGPKMEEHQSVGYFDQLRACVETLKTNPNSRRLVVSAWEPSNAWSSKLPPCHLLYIFNVQEGRLCLHMTQRSCDFGLGVPFNIASYALLTHIVAQEVGLIPGILSITFVDAHIYCANESDKTLVNGVPRSQYDHTRALQVQCERPWRVLPALRITPTIPMWDLEIDDIELLDYHSHDAIKMLVAV